MTVVIRSLFSLRCIFTISNFNIEDLLSETERREEKGGNLYFISVLSLFFYVHGHWVDLCDHYNAVCLKMVAARKIRDTDNGQTNSGI
jgi:hypothetical protein